MLRLTYIALALCLASPAAMAHGGQYNGPSDAGGGKTAGPGSVAPPTNPGGAATASSGSGEMTGGNSGTGTRGRPGRQGGRANDRGPATTGGDRRGPAVESWLFWWENNKDRYLSLKDRLQGRFSVTNSVTALTRHGRHASRQATRRPDSQDVELEIIPVLLGLAKNSDQRDILDSAILALGRCSTESSPLDQILDLGTALLSHRELSVQSAAALSLGVLGSSKSAESLSAIARNDSRGRILTGGGSVHWLVRAFAALSLGLLADEASVDSLMDLIERLGPDQREVKACAITALGLLGSEHPRALDARQFLEEQLGDRRMDPNVQSYIPTALGKLGHPSSVQPLLVAFSGRDTDHPVRQSAAIGLGLLASVDDSEALSSLVDYVRGGKDQHTRHFALIALAQIGARDAAPREHAEWHAQFVKQLDKEIAGAGASKAHRSWGALAAAIYAGRHPDTQPALLLRIRSAYKKESDPSFKSAFALALGMLEDRSSGPMILADFKESHDVTFKGIASLALGFLNHRESLDLLRSTCRSKATEPTLRARTATGLGLMGDREAVSALIATLEGAQTLGVSSAAAKALGLLGDRRCIQPLVSVLGKKDVPALTRAFACVALGVVGEKTSLPWNTPIRADNNYLVPMASINELIDIL